MRSPSEVLGAPSERSPSGLRLFSLLPSRFGGEDRVSGARLPLGASFRPPSRARAGSTGKRAGGSRGRVAKARPRRGSPLSSGTPSSRDPDGPGERADLPSFPPARGRGRRRVWGRHSDGRAPGGARERKVRSKIGWLAGSRDSHHVSRFAASLHPRESRDIRRRELFRCTSLGVAPRRSGPERLRARRLGRSCADALEQRRASPRSPRPSPGKTFVSAGGLLFDYGGPRGAWAGAKGRVDPRPSPAPGGGSHLGSLPLREKETRPSIGIEFVTMILPQFTYGNLVTTSPSSKR